MWFRFCLVLVAASFLGLNVPAPAFQASVRAISVCEGSCKTYDVTRFGAKPNDGKDDAPAVNKLLSQAGKNATIHFPSGTYDFKSTISRDGLQNVLFQGERGTLLRKAKPFKGEYLLYSRFSRNVGLHGLTLQGLTTRRDAYAWGEQGVYFGSSDGILIDGNTFRDFGDAAIRVASSPAGNKGISSSNTVVQNNEFDNVTQISTTSSSTSVGGTSGYLVQNNRFRNLKGSVKFASRTPGAGQVIVRNNTIAGSPKIPTSTGIEVSSYSNVFIENNRISDCGGFGMNIYTNTVAGLKGFDWGNYRINGNTIRDCKQGIRVSAQPYKSGYTPKVSQIIVQNNTIDVPAPKPVMINGKVQSQVQGNHTL